MRRFCGMNSYRYLKICTVSYGVRKMRMSYLGPMRIDFGKNLWLDRVREIVMKNDVPISLSHTQFKILDCLARNIGRPVSIQSLIESAWGPNSLMTKDEVYVQISRIRNRLGDNRVPAHYLITVRGFGYILARVDGY